MDAKRRFLWVVAALAFALVLGVAVGSRARATSFCGDTIRGTGGPDTLVGDRFGGPCYDASAGGGGEDGIRDLRLPDSLRSNDGSDRLYGGPGRDRTYGGAGADTLHAGRGDDHVTTEHDASKDFVDCGPGRGTVHLPAGPSERPDAYRNCEHAVAG